ncbi:hypothetical protein [Hyphococcus lacteus]|uniref:Alpha/beta hydrolase n=1 Tax=Hyphococcus lacteus TaxID=3143536 RepID=A0ABV3Z794_9PROT
MISSILLVALGFGIFALIITAALSPLETLSWWAGWTEAELEDPSPEHRNTTDTNAGTVSHTQQYVVYLSGVASLSGNFLLPREHSFIRKLRKSAPHAVVISDVFPYSPQGLPLLESPRLFDRTWRRVQKLKLDGRESILSALINLRNIFQVMVSADHRYGPIFNQGAASVIEHALLKAGYPLGSGAPITIIGYSGGAQVALGATSFLAARFKATISVISLGGVIASDPGLQYVSKLHHIVGDGDKIQKLGAIIFPERWAIVPHSNWNIAKHDERIKQYTLSDMVHAGVNGYFGRPERNGISNAERLVKLINKILNE